MATFHSTQDTSPQQCVSSFVNNNRYQVTETAVVPPQERNNAKLFNAGRKRKFIPDYQQHMYNNIPNKQPARQTTQQFFCEICKVQLNSLSQATHHKRGKSHQLIAKKKEILYSMKDSTDQHASSSELSSSPNPTILPKAKTTPQGRVDQECIICYKKFNSKTQAEQHFNGQSHKRKLQALHHVGKIGENNQTEPAAEEAATGTLSQEQLEEGLSVGTTVSETALSSENTETDELHCEFCCVTLNSKSQMDMHLAGAKHKNSVSRAASLPADGDVPMMFYCEDCNMSFNSQNQLVQHLTSPKHLNIVHRHPTAGQFRGATRGRGRGQGRGRGALRGGQSNRGRAVLSKPPPIALCFVKANSDMANMDNQGYPFFPPGQSMNHTPNFSGENPSFQQPFV